MSRQSSPVAEQIAAHHRQIQTPRIEEQAFGTSDPARIADMVSAFCREQLQAGPAGCRFYEANVGAVVGVDLDDGRAVVLKVHTSGSSCFLGAVHQVQESLERKGFPCPRPVLGPIPFGAGLCTVQELIDEGERRVVGVEERRMMARLLAQVVRDAEPLPALGRRFFADGQLWAPSHHPDFDVRAGGPANKWIETFAIEARRRFGNPKGPRVVGHMDWAVKQFRFWREAVRVVYDWDSLDLRLEPEVVGSAAVMHRITWYQPTNVAPTPDEARAFVAEYEEGRGRSFTSAERKTLGAHAAFMVADSSRWEAYRFPDSPFRPGGFREALRDHGDEFLRL